MAGPLQIKIYVVYDAAGRVVGLKLSRASASTLATKYPGGWAKPMFADKT